MSRESDRPEIDLERILESMRSLEPEASVEEAAADRVRHVLAQTPQVLSGSGQAAGPSRAGAPPVAGASRGDTPVESLRIVGCEGAAGLPGYQDLIPALLAGELSPGRALLLEQHARECVACRRSLRAARSGATLRPIAGPRAVPAAETFERPLARRAPGPAWFALAAAALLAVAGLGSWMQSGWQGIAGAQEARLRDVRGEVLLVGSRAGDPTGPIVTERSEAGTPSTRALQPGETIRTARGGSAFVELADGSLIEMRERSELSLAARSDGTAIQLARGDIIVQAAKQKQGHLYVATDDALVSVVGTVFAVDSGLGGSRVSVLEGEVHVASDGVTRILLPGDQIATREGVERTSLEAEVAWSRNVDRHIALVRELAALRRDLDEALPAPEARHSTRLLDLAPRDTVFYVSLPNLSEGIGEARRMIEERIRKNETLRAWWEESLATGDRSLVEQAVDQLQTFGREMGGEIVVTGSLRADGNFGGLLVLAELNDSARFRSLLEKELPALNARWSGRSGSKGSVPSHEALPLRLLPEDLNASGVASGDDEGLLVWTHGGMLAASNSVDLLRDFSAATDLPGASPFLAEPFRARLSESYRDGVELLVGVDLHRILERAPREHGPGTEAEGPSEQALLQTGLLDMSHLIIERRGEGRGAEGRTTDTAVLTFDQARRGVASWLAAPAPMGGLQFISRDASFVASAVVKEPVALVDDLFALARIESPDFEQELARFEADSGLSVREDFARSVGGEFTVALDGPVLPTPSWKFVAEIYDPARFQSAFEALIAQFNAKAAEAPSDPDAPSIPRLVTGREEAGGRTWFSLSAGGSSLAAHYTFEDGYLVAGPSRALLERALDLQESGTTFGGSTKLAGLLPQGARVDFSALLYQDLGSIAEPFAQRVAGFGGQLAPEQRAALAELGDTMQPSLAWAWAEENRILVAGTRNGRGFGSELASLFGMGGPLDAAALTRLLSAGAGGDSTP